MNGDVSDVNLKYEGDGEGEIKLLLLGRVRRARTPARRTCRRGRASIKAANLAGPGVAFQSNLSSARGSASGAGASTRGPASAGGGVLALGSASESARGSTSAVAGDSARGSLGSAGAAIGSASPLGSDESATGGSTTLDLGGRRRVRLRPGRDGASARGGRFEGVEGGAAGHGGGVWAAESGVGASRKQKQTNSARQLLKRAMDVGARWR